ncbi:MAG: DUF1934 domain-containing protein [Phascolarctobacterium sp.]|nr:DUF1934 domain-containing protein [Phascolarctobacterium sp.]
MKPVKIRIVSTVKDEKGKPQPTEQLCLGKMAEKNGTKYVFYEESALTGLEGTKTTIKWNDERIIILRSGSLEHRQEFCQGLVDKSLYQTPYIKIPLETVTKYLYTGFRRGVWNLEIEYTLSHGGQPYGDMKILIEIEEDTEGGH